MDGNRNAEGTEPNWYTGSPHARSADSDVSGSHALGGGTSGSSNRAYDSGVHERPSGAFRLPEQRPAVTEQRRYPPADSLSTTGSHALAADPGLRSSYEPPRMPARGPEYPAIRPSETPPAASPTSEGPGRPRDGVYQTRRGASSLMVAIGMIILLVPAGRLLVHATFTSEPAVRTIVPAVLLVLGLVLTGVGLFGVAGNRPASADGWLRPPVVYLPAGLLLLLAAGLAVA